MTAKRSPGRIEVTADIAPGAAEVWLHFVNDRPGETQGRTTSIALSIEGARELALRLTRAADLIVV